MYDMSQLEAAYSYHFQWVVRVVHTLVQVTGLTILCPVFSDSLLVDIPGALTWRVIGALLETKIIINDHIGLQYKFL